jgi:hypothetical protein
VRFRPWCEAELESFIGGLNTAGERRALAQKFGRWSRQLLFSADLIERLEPVVRQPSGQNIIDPGLMRLASELEQQAEAIRNALGYGSASSTQVWAAAQKNSN